MQYSSSLLLQQKYVCAKPPLLLQRRLRCSHTHHRVEIESGRQLAQLLVKRMMLAAHSSGRRLGRRRANKSRRARRGRHLRQMWRHLGDRDRRLQHNAGRHGAHGRRRRRWHHCRRRRLWLRRLLKLALRDRQAIRKALKTLYRPHLQAMPPIPDRVLRTPWKPLGDSIPSVAKLEDACRDDMVLLVCPRLALL